MPMTGHKRKLIFGNWKMNVLKGDLAGLLNLAKARLPLLEKASLEVAVFPPFTLLAALADIEQNYRIKLGAQDLYHEDKGAFTGEISAAQLKDLNCRYALVGHSERRHIIGESEPLLAKKTAAAIRNGLCPVYCVGEKLEHRDSGRQFEVVREQLSNLRGVGGLGANNLIVAYEPVWAIGTGRNATGEQAQEMHLHVRKCLKNLGLPPAVPVLYGGSVKPSNVEELMSQPDIDGALIGGASIIWNDFFDMIAKVSTL